MAETPQPPYTDEQLAEFRMCKTLLAEGCVMSQDMEDGLRKRLWWVTANSAYRIVRTWFRNREKIDAILSSMEGTTTEDGRSS